jgi:hypothetical protein
MKWEQISEVVETGGVVTRGRVDSSKLNELLMKRGAEGYELVTAIPISDGAVGTRRVVLFFKRPVQGLTSKQAHK